MLGEGEERDEAEIDVGKDIISISYNVMCMSH